jgi:hypothetical protein
MGAFGPIAGHLEHLRSVRRLEHLEPHRIGERLEHVKQRGGVQ